jgi:hypothetical protein
VIMDDLEFDIEWIPEDTGAPYEADDKFPDIPSHTIDKLCKKNMAILTGLEWDRCHQQIWLAIRVNLTILTELFILKTKH